ncbi:MAG: glycosyltransferase family 39 protein [Chloroflexi bacterium]|nr:glycosyltransferase family 39 protein [Chloroflexota bacterium]
MTGEGTATLGQDRTVKRPRFGRLLLDRLRQNLSDPDTALALLLIAALIVRIVWLTLPQNSLIFDESYYVNAARVLLGWTVPDGAPYAGSPIGLDPNTEHPPLGKLLMALSMAAFGDNGLGWRLPSVIAGMIALVALYKIVRAAGESSRLALLVVGLAAFENLTIVHGRIGTLDMLVLAPILVGAWLALSGRWAAAGAATGVGMLMKLTALYGLLALLIMLAFALAAAWRRQRRLGLSDFRPTAATLIAFSVVTIGGLWLLDLRFSSYPNPVAHLQHMVEYGANLARAVQGAGSCPGNDSSPWQWLFNECQMSYLRVDVSVKAGDKLLSTYPTIDFRGAMNPILIGTLPIAFLFTGWYAWKKRNRLAGWAVVWAAANYLPFVVLAVASSRITYIYYFLPVVPALAIAVALLLRRSGLPRPVAWAYVVIYAAGFVAYFPFRQIP